MKRIFAIGIISLSLLGTCAAGVSGGAPEPKGPAPSPQEIAFFVWLWLL